MDLSAPYRAVLSKNEGGVLSVLAGTNEPLTGRDVARLAGGARSTVARLLRRLVDHGVVRVAEAGSSRLYSLNREHLLAEPILALVRPDRHVHASLGKRPLDVGADRIARTALATLEVLDTLRELTGAPLPLAWSPAEPVCPAAIEVYPAATLRAHGVDARGYKVAGASKSGRRSRR